jgi:hypothetical protein
MRPNVVVVVVVEVVVRVVRVGGKGARGEYVVTITAFCVAVKDTRLSRGRTPSLHIA